MYETILRFMSREIDAQNVVVAIGDFFVIFVGSILVGTKSQPHELHCLFLYPV